MPEIVTFSGIASIIISFFLPTILFIGIIVICARLKKIEKILNEQYDQLKFQNKNTEALLKLEIIKRNEK